LPIRQTYKTDLIISEVVTLSASVILGLDVGVAITVEGVATTETISGKLCLLLVPFL
jgi:hypothetical protein